MNHRTTSTSLVITLALGALMSGACGSDSAYEGIYTVTTWTENDASCDAEGASVLADKNQTIFYIKRENFFGTKFLNVKFCADVSECEALAGDDGTINIGSFSFESGDDSGWSGGFYAGSAGQDGVCTGSWDMASLTGDPAVSIRIETTSTPAGGFPPESDGFCDDKRGEDAAQGQPCAALEVVTATRVGDLP